MEDIELTPDEIEKVNKIVTGIQSDLDAAIKAFGSGNYDLALNFVKSGISKSNCPVCKRELGILIADITHNKEICILNADNCEDERKVILEQASELRNDFVPITTKKKALKEKAEELKKSIPIKEKESEKQRKISHLPLPHEILFSFSRRK